ncbi:MAG: tRNA (adenosine(37)-N6)-threonylcarbamoyltransferase complex dimerization subunit type 1 TsaB [Flavobacteriaceae bacterium]
MALLLNLETATTNCSVSLATNGESIAIKQLNTPNYSHSEQLHLFIAQVLEEAGKVMNDLDAIAVSKGPGSYTGLRIGVSAAKGLCYALDKPLISIPTLESMAYQCQEKGVDFVIPLLDARRMEVYSAVFDATGGQVRETLAEIIDINSFERYATKGTVLLAGSGAEKCRAILTSEKFSFDTDIVPSALEMSALSFQKFQKKDFEDVAYFEPYYLKDFMLHTKQKK